MLNRLKGMITYQKLHSNPAAFVSLTGLRPEAFDDLRTAYSQAQEQQRQQTTCTKRHGQPRQRAVGAGRRFSHDTATRLLMALFWLRVYPTFEVLGFFFSLAKSNASTNVHEVLTTLESLSDFAFERPAQERQKLRSVAAVMDAFPDVALVIDAKEQRVQRPKSKQDKGHQEQKAYYSGKKKAHTLKTQVAVNPQGRFEAVSQSVPGAQHDITLLRHSKLLDNLAPDEASMMDKGYDGIVKDYPAQIIYQPYKARRNNPLSPEQKAHNRWLAKYRIIVEHSIAQLNQFQVLAQVFRHARDKHSQIVRVVAGIVNRRIEVQPLKTYATAA